MNILIINFVTPEYADFNYKSLKWWNYNIPNCKYYTVSEICENWPYDYNVSSLKNKCLDVAKKLRPDWMILMPGADCALRSLPNLESLDKNKIYWGNKFDEKFENRKSCSIFLYSNVVYDNYRYDERHNFYYDDYDFFHLKTKNIDKQKLDSFLCVHLDHVPLPLKNDYVKQSFFNSKSIFENDYYQEFKKPCEMNL